MKATGTHVPNLTPYFEVEAQFAFLNNVPQKILFARHHYNRVTENLLVYMLTVAANSSVSAY